MEICFIALYFYAVLADSRPVCGLRGAAGLKYITMAFRSRPYFISFPFRDNREDIAACNAFVAEYDI